MNGNMPWFPFFAADWLLSRSRKRMSLEARGLYADMLAHQWEGGPLPTEPDELAALLEVDVMVVHRAWPQLSPCFERCADGIVNVKLEDLRDAQARKHARMVEAGKRGAKTRRHR